MIDDANAPENLTKLAEEAKLVAETTQDPNRRRALRLMSLKYKRLAEFSRKQPDERDGRDPKVKANDGTAGRPKLGATWLRHVVYGTKPLSEACSVCVNRPPFLPRSHDKKTNARIMTMVRRMTISTRPMRKRLVN